ncbi:hypothetical protein BDN72DRAFT_888543 [Pluteus cervinus]|uniref:Uncharacterized protein n=1 Tax=Pluteus cervinus TaxID=181527 RepID=A0ACD3ARA3_9AGAR|nr:hypothetical protein BDN72DRAFT_888543 [Pluteus cervinus]
MDPFEVRMHALGLLKRLNASQQSIQKLVTFAVRNFTQCGEDIWTCIVEECENGSINSRINILYFLDSLCETCLLLASRPTSSSSQVNAGIASGLYVKYLAQDVAKIVKSVVPEGREGLPNLISTKQILESWRTKRIIDPQKVDDVLSTLNARKAAGTTSEEAPTGSSARQSSSLARAEVFKRIEEDRERHKRLRERRWVQPITHNPASHHPPQLASFLPLPDTDGALEVSLDIEFENDWETTSDWNEDDDEAAREEAELCFPAEGEGPMDLS